MKAWSKFRLSAWSIWCLHPNWDNSIELTALFMCLSRAHPISFGCVIALKNLRKASRRYSKNIKDLPGEVKPLQRQACTNMMCRDHWSRNIPYRMAIYDWHWFICLSLLIKAAGYILKSTGLNYLIYTQIQPKCFKSQWSLDGQWAQAKS